MNSTFDAWATMISKISVKDALKSSSPQLRAILRTLLVRPLRFYIRFASWQATKLFLFNTFAVHLWWLEASVDARTVNADALRVDASDIVGKHIYYFGVWEPNLIAFSMRRLKPVSCS